MSKNSYIKVNAFVASVVFNCLADNLSLCYLITGECIEQTVH